MKQVTVEKLLSAGYFYRHAGNISEQCRQDFCRQGAYILMNLHSSGSERHSSANTQELNKTLPRIEASCHFL